MVSVAYRRPRKPSFTKSTPTTYSLSPSRYSAISFAAPSETVFFASDARMRPFAHSGAGLTTTAMTSASPVNSYESSPFASSTFTVSERPGNSADAPFSMRSIFAGSAGSAAYPPRDDTLTGLASPKVYVSGCTSPRNAGSCRRTSNVATFPFTPSFFVFACQNS